MTFALQPYRCTSGPTWRRGGVLFLAAFCATLIFHSPLSAQEAAPYDRYDQQQQDPPERVARLSFLQGNVSLQTAGVDQFGQAEANYPLSNGDRIYVDNQSHAELQSGALAIRLGNGADLTLTNLNDQFAQLGLAQGSIHVRTYSLVNGTSVEIDTPNGTVTVVQPGDVRIDSFPQDDTTVVTVLSGEAEASGPNLNQTLYRNQSLKLTGSNPIYTQYLGLLPPDDLDYFEQQRDHLYLNNYAVQNQYVSPEMIGSADLGESGEWQPMPEYGVVWFPRVAVGWRPYYYGHWAWVAPWGWTWIEQESWGFAPFHYGRWAVFNGRWGWVPGPPIVRPVYSPALVAFVGGPSLSVSVSVGAVTAWFPLGPREPYVPWYHCSPGYVNRVNVTNIYNRNVNEVHNIYNNRTTNIYVNKTTVINNITYVNRSVATTVVPQKSFAAGRPAAESANLHLEAQTRQQLTSAPVLPHPLITPSKQIVAVAPARAVPANQARPVLETRRGLEQAVPGATAHPVPVKTLSPAQQQPMPRELTKSSTPVQPAREPVGPLNAGAPKPVPAVQQPQRPNMPQQAERESQPQAQPQHEQAPQVRAEQTEARSQQTRPEEREPQPPAPRPADQRTLINKATPPPSHPTFEQQRVAIEKTDPGRPLSPAQAENVRNNRPAGPAQQPEAIAHPAPKPQPKPEEKSSNHNH